MGKSILMLGGSRQQVIAIKKARELGYRDRFVRLSPG